MHHTALLPSLAAQASVILLNGERSAENAPAILRDLRVHVGCGQITSHASRYSTGARETILQKR